MEDHVEAPTRRHNTPLVSQAPFFRFQATGLPQFSDGLKKSYDFVDYLPVLVRMGTTLFTVFYILGRRQKPEAPRFKIIK